MDIFIDNSDKKKIAFIQTIFDSDQHTCSLDMLERTVNVNRQTIFSLRQTILEDIRLANFSDLITIDYASANQLFMMSISEAFNIQTLINLYVKRSIKYRLIYSLLTSTFETLQEAADHLNVSYIQIRRVISELNVFLESINLKIHSRRSVFLAGDEITLRFFYTVLFVSSDGITAWPFPSFSYHEISALLGNCPTEVYHPKSLDKLAFTHFYLAVHLLRERQGFSVHKEDLAVPLYQPYSSSNIDEFKVFYSSIGKYLPHYSDSKVIENSQIICSSLVALGGYASVGAAPDFFFFDSELDQQTFSQEACTVINQVDNYLQEPLTTAERTRMLYLILCLYYRISYIGKPLEKLRNLLPYYFYEASDSRKQYKMKAIHSLFEQVLHSMDFHSTEPFYGYMLLQYCLIYDKCTKFEKHNSPIIVAFISVVSNQTLQKDVTQYFSSYFSITIADKLSSDIDLIISEVPVSSEVISALRLHQPILYCHQKLVNSDYEKITEALATIANRKSTLIIEE